MEWTASTNKRDRWCNNYGGCNEIERTAITKKWDSATIVDRGWCNKMGWTAGAKKCDRWCNIGRLVQQDKLLKRNGTLQQLWLVQRNGMDSQHNEMGWMVQHRDIGAARLDGQPAWRNGMDGATSEGWCNEMEWTASTTKWDGWCNIGILVQRDGMISQHGKMGWMVQHRRVGATRWNGQPARRNGMDGATSGYWCSVTGWSASMAKWDG